ncbi:unnamed protein product, partial [Sphacelaria rigidula]
MSSSSSSGYSPHHPNTAIKALPSSGQQQTSLMNLSGAMGRSSVFALPLMRGDRPQLPAFGSPCLAGGPQMNSGKQSLGGLLGVGSFSSSHGGESDLQAAASNPGGSMSSGGASMPSLSSMMNHSGQGSLAAWHASG